MFFDPRMIGRVCLSLREVITPVVNGLKPTCSQEYIYIYTCLGGQLSEYNNKYI